jgi:predicted GNAT family acetyltransferase
MMQVELKLDKNNNGGFYIMDGAERIAEMAISISGKNLTVYHTEVSQKAEGKGLGKELLSAMVDYARKNGLKVIALCPFVHAQFKRHPEQYADIWNKQSE